MPIRDFLSYFRRFSRITVRDYFVTFINSRAYGYAGWAGLEWAGLARAGVGWGRMGWSGLCSHGLGWLAWPGLDEYSVLFIVSYQFSCIAIRDFYHTFI